MNGIMVCRSGNGAPPPPPSKHVLAPQNEFGMPKITWPNYKRRGIWVDPPLFFQNSHIFPFFLWQTSLSQKLKVSVFGWDEHAFYETKFRRKLKDIRISAPSSVSPFCVLAIPDKTPTSICYPGTSRSNLWFRN